MKKTIILLAAAGMLDSCGIYSKYSHPETEIHTDSLYRADATAGTASIAALSWRELFTDTHLQRLIAAGLERNTDLGIARLQTEEAQAVLASARLAYLPSVSLAPHADISHYNGTTKKTYNLGASASWEIDIFGKITNAKLEAAAAYEQRAAYGQAVESQLVATVAESYYTLLMLDEQLAIAQQTLENWDETIAALEALMEAGMANDVAVRQTRASRTALEASALTISQRISETENSLCALLKQPSHAISRGSLARQDFPDSLSTGMPLLLLANRPDIRQAEAELAEAFYAVNSARSAFYPSLTLSGSLGWTNSGATIANPGKWLSSAIAQLTAPIFNRGVNTANLKVAKARQQEATLRFEQALLNAGNEVNNALTAWQTAEKRIALDQKQIEDLDAAVEKTRLLVEHTSANYLEVLTARQSLLNARLTLAQDRTDRIMSIIQLYHALGGGRK